MELDYGLAKNKYGMPKELYEKVKDIIEKCLMNINHLDLEQMSYKDNLAIIGLIGEMYPLLIEKEKWLEKALIVLNNIKLSIETLEMSRLGLHEGLANAGYFTTVMYQNAGYFKNSMNSMNRILITSTLKQIRLMEQKKDTSMVNSWFDAVSGISGIGCYLLYSNEICPDDSKVYCIEQIDHFLIKLARYDKVSEYDIPAWYTRQDVENESVTLPSSYINYSLSHGIAGVLAFLTKALEYGIRVDGQVGAISFIVTEMMKVHQNLMTAGYLSPGVLSLDQYTRSCYAQRNNRLSWCYGALGELTVLQASACALQNHELQTQISDQIMQITKWGIEKYCLASPIICHGYAGAAVMFYNIYERLGIDVLRNRGNKLLECMLHLYNEETKYGFADCSVKMNGNNKIPKEADKLDFLEGSCGCIMTMLMVLKERVNFLPLLML